MICKIADLIADVPTAGGLAPRCVDYLVENFDNVDIAIKEENYRLHCYDKKVGENVVAYMESAFQFYRELVNYNGFYLHCSAVVRDGKAYLFSGNPGAGKSTHAKLWIDTFGGNTRIINDDKPALRYIDGIWYAYGTPWCGKDGINLNEKAPVAGLCFMKKAQENGIRRLASIEAMHRIMPQTIYRFNDVHYLDVFTAHLDKFLRVIPVFELENRPEPEAAMLSYETMYRAAQEAGL